MKTILIIVCCAVVILSLSHSGTEPAVAMHRAIAASGTDTLDFKTDIQPILQKNCSPCHFAGGKMYEKMPFDKGETIISHEAGALKRFKDKNENALIRQFIEERKPG